MASIYPRRRQLWMRLKAADGEWYSERTEFVVGQEAKAKRYAARAQENLDKRRGKPDPRITFRAYIAEWTIRRRESGHDWNGEFGKLDKHVLPVLGDQLLTDIRTSQIADLVHRLRFRSSPRLAQRTVHNVYRIVAAAMRDAAVEGRIEISPCILKVAQLGRIVDSDPEWRSGAVFTRAEACSLISDPRIPADRHLVYAFGLLAGMRPGEGAALRWRHYDATGEPLGRLLVATSYNTKRSATKGTKTETSKVIPVHPTLAAMLAEWRLSGWATMMGRAPTPEDLIIPLPPDTVARRTKRTGEAFRGYDFSGRRWRDEDLPTLGWRPRSVYDTKSTFVTLAIEDGADPTILRDRVTHTKQRRTAFDGYDRGAHWEATCREVAKLRIGRLATPLATAPVNPAASLQFSGSEGGDRTLARSHDRPSRSGVVVGRRPVIPDSHSPSGREGVATLATRLAEAVLDGDQLLARRLAGEVMAAADRAVG